MMTTEQMIEALSTEYQIIPKDKENRVSCWICGQWQKESLTRILTFGGMEEVVCLSCLNAVKERESTLEMEAMYDELPHS